MSYNITEVQIVRSDATIDAAAAARVRREADFPTYSFVDDLPATGIVPVTDLSWCDDFSEQTWEDTFVAKIVPLIRGTVDFIVVWEGGDALCGHRITDGSIVDVPVGLVESNAVVIRPRAVELVRLREGWDHVAMELDLSVSREILGMFADTWGPVRVEIAVARGCGERAMAVLGIAPDRVVEI